MHRFRSAIVAAIVAAAMLAPTAALAANRFYGVVQHVSMNNLKVHNRRTGQTLSFEILPKFDRIFSTDGKTTYQMKDIKRGRAVEVIYDQKALGIRHADEIILR